MKAFILQQPGTTDQLELSEVPIPEPGTGEVLVKVKAISINPVDWKTRQGKGIYGRLKELGPLILGWDISGVVERVGEGVEPFKAGDPVFGMVNFPGHGKCYAEYVAVPAAQLALKPDSVSHQQAAAATLAALTAWQVLVHKAKLQAGQKVLIHAAAGGVGHYAVQIAKHLGAYVIGSSSPAKKEFVMHLGADEHLDYQAKRFEEAVRDADLVLDAVGGETFLRSLDAVKPGGLVISIPSGLPAEVAEAAKQKGVMAAAMLVESSGTDMQAIASLLSQGKLRSHIDAVYSFNQLGEAHQELEKGRTSGKIIVSLDQA